MLAKVYLISALCATAFSAPTLSYSPGAAAVTPDMKVLSDYFRLISSKIQAGRNMAAAPVCNLARAQLPASGMFLPSPIILSLFNTKRKLTKLSSIALPSPASGLTVYHVAIGRGTQNYTCSSNATAAPTALGAVATLYNASCIASTYPDLLLAIPNLALQFPTPPSTSALSPSNLMVSGHHFFSNGTTPVFDLNTPGGQFGSIACAKNSSTPAPVGASAGIGGKGFGAVPWLRLLTRDVQGNLQEVYRVNTAGGSAPPTCEGIINTTFEVQYAAEYWFFKK